MDTIRWGLVSTANINRRLIPAIRSSRRGKLIAVASRDKTRAESYAAMWNIPQAFGSYEAMLESGTIDAVYISLPNHLHATWSINAMLAGLHVLCEKPLALSVLEVDDMIATSERTGCVLAEAFMYRHHPQTKLAGEWVRSGRLGDIKMIRSVFTFTLQEKHGIRLIPEFGGGSLWDIGVYPISFTQFILGEAPQHVHGFASIGETGVDETFIGVLQFTGDRIASIASSFYTPFHTSAEIYGTEGRLTLNRPFVSMDEKRRMLLHPVSGEPREIPVPSKELYLGQVEDIHAAILDNSQPYLSLQESRDHIRTVCALYDAAQDGQTVELGPTDLHKKGDYERKGLRS